MPYQRQDFLCFLHAVISVDERLAGGGTDKKAAVIIPIYHPDWKFLRLIEALKQQKQVHFDVYIIDSGSDRRCCENALDGLFYTWIQTTPQAFNHGGTRRRAAQSCDGYPYLVYMTQDAIPTDEYALSSLLRVFSDETVGLAYGRQLPQLDAGVLAAHARLFNYSEQSRIKSLQDAPELGIKTAFCSNVFAAYRRTALMEAGNFPEHVILGEDTCAAGKMLINGWRIAYCADAKVYHSHNYSIWQEFKRYFDTGVLHAQYPWIRKTFGRAEGEGRRFVLSETRYVMRHSPFLLPGMICRDGCKLLGYRLGLWERKLPLGIKKKLSMHARYWDS